MPEAPWQLLVVDDDPTICEQIYTRFNSDTVDDSGDVGDDDSDKFRVTTTNDFSQALQILITARIDIVILDVRHNQAGREHHSGIETLEKIKASRFVPIIFYTGVAHLVRRFESDVIRVVEKTETLTGIDAQLKRIISSGIPDANRAILRHVEHVQRDFMWKLQDVLEPYRMSTDKLSIAILMARRLAASLEKSPIDQLAKALGHDGDLHPDDDTVHPMFFYIIPPITSITTGAINLDQSGGHWVVLTNSCDLEMRAKNKKKPDELTCNAEHILVAHCRPFASEPEVLAWKAKPTGSDELERLHKLIKNNRGGGQPERYFFLPAGLDFPDLVVDVQNTKVMSSADLSRCRCLANIDSPYLESLIARFTRYFSRIGTPDINIQAVLQRLK